MKETKEMVIGLGEVAKLVAKVVKDKSVDLKDLQHVMAMDFTKVTTGIEGVQLIKAEISEITLEQAKELLTLLVDQVSIAKAV